MHRIYLDNSATTKICDEALEEYIRVSRECYGNPSSLHAMGFEAEKEISRAKEIISGTVGAKGATVVDRKSVV